MPDASRAAVASFLSVHKGQEKGVTRLTTANGLHDHPFIDAAYQHLQETWTEVILPEQQLLSSPEHWSGVLAHVPDAALRAELHSSWCKQGSAHSSEDINVSRWHGLVNKLPSMTLEGKTNPSKAQLAAAANKAKKDIVFSYAYPRLDVEVSKKMNHLLKAPFCVHPKTGKVCVPINPADAESFDPVTGVPTVSQLLTELDKSSVSLSSEDMQNQWRHTSLEKYVRDFQNYFLNDLLASNREELARKARIAAAQPTTGW